MGQIDTIIQQRYKILHPLGEGGQARTYLARDIKRGEKVVLKMLSLGRAADWKSIELFEREAAVLEGLKHPAIPAYIDAFYREDAGFYLVQEYLEGDSLQACWDASEVRFDDDGVRDLLADILPILVYLQSFSPPIIHRDIKPSNILVSAKPDWLFCLIDFGAVQRILHGGVGGSTVVGTSGYMPPEQLMGRAQPATDLYALAATCIYVASGIEPSQLPVKRMRLQFREYVDLSARLSSILEKMLEPDIDDRFGSAQEVLDALKAPGWAPLSSSSSTSKSRENTTREVALKERVAHPPMMTPASRVELSEGRLLIELPIRVKFPIKRVFVSAGVIVSGLALPLIIPDFIALFGFVGVVMIFAGFIALIISCAKFFGDAQDCLCISAKGVEYQRIKSNANQRVYKKLFMSLNSLRNCYLGDASQDSKWGKKSGIVFQDSRGRKALFGGGNTVVRREDTRASSPHQAGLDDEELRWLFDIVQTHLESLNERAEKFVPTES